MQYNPANPLIVQGDRTVLLEVDNPLHAEARDAIAPFAELEKSPEHIHTYRLTPLSLWNAAAAGMSADEMLDALSTFSKFPLPPNLLTDLRELVSRYGRVSLRRVDGQLRLICTDKALLEELARQKGVRDFLGARIDATSFAIDDAFRGVLKQALIARRLPGRRPRRLHRGGRAGNRAAGRRAVGVAVPGPRLPADGRRRLPRRGRRPRRVGVIVLPCGAGKTIVGITAMAALKKSTLVLTTSTTAVEQWRREILDKTDLDESLVATYTGDSKAIAPVTLATYQIVTYRPKKDGDFPHFALFNERDWGLIIYDEVHLLPAPVFRVTAEIQARRRLGLTATLVREDNREEDVFSLIGPKKFDVPWRVLESKGWIAEAQCHEVRLGLPEEGRMEYAVAEWRDKFRLASENPVKDDLIAAPARTARRAGGPGPDHRPVPQATAADRRAVRHPADHRADLERGPRGPLRQVPPRRASPAGALEGGELRDRSARRERDDPGVGHVRQPAGRGPAARPHPPPEGGRGAGHVLYSGHPGHAGDGFRPSPAALPDGAGV